MPMRVHTDICRVSFYPAVYRLSRCAVLHAHISILFPLLPSKALYRQTSGSGERENISNHLHAFVLPTHALKVPDASKACP